MNQTARSAPIFRVHFHDGTSLDYQAGSPLIAEARARERRPDVFVRKVKRLREADVYAAAPTMTGSVEKCPVCADPLGDDDICATDIEMGICHSACLEGSAIVDLKTGVKRGGPIHTYRYGDTAPATSGTDPVANSYPDK